MNKRKSVYDQLAPICGVERKHNGFLLHFGANDQVKVNNSTQARQEALKRLCVMRDQQLHDTPLAREGWVADLITELEQYLEEYCA